MASVYFLVAAAAWKSRAAATTMSARARSAIHHRCEHDAEQNLLLTGPHTEPTAAGSRTWHSFGIPLVKTVAVAASAPPAAAPAA